MVRPVTAIGEVVPASTQLPAPTLYWNFDTATPPFEPGVNATEAEPLPAVAEVTDGAAGVVRGPTGTAVDAVPSPAAFTARNLTL